MLKFPLIIAAILVVGRVVLERGGAPGWLNNLFSLVIFYVFVAPLYFAFRIANSGVDRPYRTLFKKIALFTALARSMRVYVVDSHPVFREGLKTVLSNSHDISVIG